MKSARLFVGESWNIVGKGYGVSFREPLECLDIVHMG